MYENEKVVPIFNISPSFVLQYALSVINSLNLFNSQNLRSVATCLGPPTVATMSFNLNCFTFAGIFTCQYYSIQLKSTQLIS